MIPRAKAGVPTGIEVTIHIRIVQPFQGSPKRTIANAPVDEPWLKGRSRALLPLACEAQRQQGVDLVVLAPKACQLDRTMSVRRIPIRTPDLRLTLRHGDVS